MKRFVCIIGVMLVLLGVRLGDNGLHGLAVSGDAVFSVYRSGGATEVMPYGEVPLLSRWGVTGGYLAQRIDFKGEIGCVADILRQLGAREVRREYLNGGELTVIYAISRRLRRRTSEQWGEFNVMIAVRGGRVAVGYPVLIGSF